MEFNQRKEKKETTSFVRKVGIGEFTVLKFNPSRYELSQILGTEEDPDEKEIVYVGQSEHGNPMIRITAWLKEKTTGFVAPLTFFLEKTDSISLSGKKQFINAVGKTSYKDSEKNLDDWFKKAKSFRVAQRGEADLMEFVRNWLQGIELNVDKGGSKNDILLDINRIFAGDLRELNNLVGSEFAGSVTALAVIKSKSINNETVTLQGIFNRKFLPGYCVKYFNPEYKGEIPATVKRFTEEILGEYGPKDYYVLEPIRDYNPEENPVSSDSPILQSDKPSY